MPALIHNIQWHLYQMPLHNTFTTSHESLAARVGVIIEITTSDGLSGYGECAPLPTFAGAPLNDVLGSLPPLQRQIQAKSPAEALSILYTQSSHLSSPTVYGLETALLDIIGQHEHLSFTDLLISTFTDTKKNTIITEKRARIPVNAVIGAMSIEETIQQAQQAINQGFRCLKIKMGPVTTIDTEVARLQNLRDTIGPNIQLRLDANEAWHFSEALTILNRCSNLDIQYVEQPLSRDNLAAMRQLREQISIPLAADEALSDLTSAKKILNAHAADIFIVKPQLAGGLLASHQIIQAAHHHGLQSVITSTIETGIGITAALHLAAATPSVTFPCGLATLPMLANDLLSTPLSLNDGYLTVPTSPGLGVQLDKTSLSHYQLPTAQRIY